MGAPEKKCALCSYPIRDADPVVVEQGDLFHTPCWRLIESNTLIVDSRRLQRRSQQRIKAAKSRIRQVRSISREAALAEGAVGTMIRIVTVLLRNVPKVYCCRCLAEMLTLPEQQLREGAQTLVLQAQLEVDQAQCAGCGRESDVLQLAL